jgi:hypothetical protein
MNDLLDITLLVVGLLTMMSALLYVLATIDPQTDRRPEVQTAPATSQGLSSVA